jgi:flagellar biosynthesis protein FliQ
VEDVCPLRLVESCSYWGVKPAVSVPTILLVLSFPAGILGYTLGARVVAALALPDQVQEIAVLFVPLLIAGLFMLPFLAPFFDRKAKQDLAAHIRSEASVSKGGDDPSGEKP